MGMLLFAALAAVSPAAGAPASALKPGMPYTNGPSGISITEYSDAKRSYQEYRPDGLDVSIRYDDNATGDFTNIYIFKRTNGDASVWMDRIEEVIGSRADVLGVPTPAGPVQAATFAGASGTPVLRRSYSLSGGKVKSTAAAILANEDFYVSVRASSYTGTPADVDKMLDRALAAIRFPAGEAPESTAPITPCTPPLAMPSAAARPAKVKSKEVMTSAMVEPAAHEIRAAISPGAVRWCVEPDDLPNLGVYREVGDAGYWIAYGDNGEAASAAPPFRLDGKDKSWFEVKVRTADRVRAAAMYKTLPSRQQVIDAINGDDALYIVTFKPDGGTDIALDEALFK